jgi:hypothetical protein
MNLKRTIHNLLFQLGLAKAPPKPTPKILVCVGDNMDVIGHCSSMTIYPFELYRGMGNSTCQLGIARMHLDRPKLSRAFSTTLPLPNKDVVSRGNQNLPFQFLHLNDGGIGPVIAGYKGTRWIADAWLEKIGIIDESTDWVELADVEMIAREMPWGC